MGWSNGIHKLLAPIDGAPASKSWSLRKQQHLIITIQFPNLCFNRKEQQNRVTFDKYHNFAALRLCPVYTGLARVAGVERGRG